MRSLALGLRDFGLRPAGLRVGVEGFRVRGLGLLFALGCLELAHFLRQLIIRLNVPGRVPNMCPFRGRSPAGLAFWMPRGRRGVGRRGLEI